MASRSPRGYTWKIAKRNSNSKKKKKSPSYRRENRIIWTSVSRKIRGKRNEKPLSTTRFKVKFKPISKTPEKSLLLQEILLKSPSPSSASPSLEQRFTSAGIPWAHPWALQKYSLKLKDHLGKSLLFLFTGTQPKGRLSCNCQVQWPHPQSRSSTWYPNHQIFPYSREVLCSPD